MEQAAVYAQDAWNGRRCGGWFSNMTRIAKRARVMWTSILLSNRETISESIADFKERLDEVGQKPSAGRRRANLELFQPSTWAASGHGIHKRGGVDGSYEPLCRRSRWRDVILRILELLRGIWLISTSTKKTNERCSRDSTKFPLKIYSRNLRTSWAQYRKPRTIQSSSNKEENIIRIFTILVPKWTQSRSAVPEYKSAVKAAKDAIKLMNKLARFCRLS